MGKQRSMANNSVSPTKLSEIVETCSPEGCGMKDNCPLLPVIANQLAKRLS